MVKEPKRKRGTQGNESSDEGRNIPECLLDTADIVILPILLGNVLLANGDAGPRDAQLGDAVDVVLVEVDLEGAEVTGRPLGQTPRLDDLLGRVELDVLARHVTVEDGKLAADVGTFELAWRAAREGGDALRVGEGGVELLGRGAHLIRSGHGGGVDADFAGGRGGGGCGDRSSLLLGGLRVDIRRGEAAGRVHAGSVLQVLGVFGDEGVGELGQRLAKLRDNLRANKIFYGLLGGRIAVVLNLKLG